MNSDTNTVAGVYEFEVVYLEASKTKQFRVYESSSYSVRYHYNYDEADEPYLNKPAEEGLPLEPERSGYSFTGWNTQSDGSGDVFDTDYVFNEELTVYAQWKKDTAEANGIIGGKKTFTITFNKEVKIIEIDKDKNKISFDTGYKYSITFDYDNGNFSKDTIYKITAEDKSNDDFLVSVKVTGQGNNYNWEIVD